MVPYFIIFLILFFLFLDSFDSKDGSKYYLSFIFVFLTLFSGLRYDIGIDFVNYIEMFNSINLGKGNNVEYGFKELIKIVLVLSGTSQFFFFVVSGITIFLFLVFFEFFSVKPVFSALLFFTLPVFYLASFNTLRQFLAISIFSVALIFVAKKHWFKYLVIMVIASSIHKSAIMFLPFYWILRKELTLSQYLIVGGFYVFMLKFIEFVLMRIGFSSIYFIETSGKKFNVISLILLLFTIVVFVKRKKLLENSQENMMFINMTFFGSLIAITPLFVNFRPDLILRMTSFFTISILIILPALIQSMKKNQQLYLYPSVIVVCLIYFVSTLYFKGDIYQLTPYSYNLKLFRF